jgi:hypothetical protein
VVRGTSNVVDAMQDLSYYSIASSLKVVLQFVLPIQHILPPEFIQELIQAMLNRAFAPIEYNELLREVKHVTGGRRLPRTSQDSPGGQTMIVGHSLGGAYANIVGVLGEIPTFTLSPPGLFYGIKKFGIDNAADLYPYITALVPDMDLVSGWLGGGCGWWVVGGGFLVGSVFEPLDLF